MMDNAERARIAERWHYGAGLPPITQAAKDIHALLQALAAVEKDMDAANEYHIGILNAITQAFPECYRFMLADSVNAMIAATKKARADLAVAEAAKECLETHPMFRSEDAKKQQTKIDAVEKLADAYRDWTWQRTHGPVRRSGVERIQS